MREDQGEITAAEGHSLPILIERGDLRGDTHVHSDWTDGVHSIEDMARAAREVGLEYMVLTDHSPSLGITRGLALERIREQTDEIARVNRELTPFRVLHGTEMEIRGDGSLDYPDEVLASLDVVIASIHTGRSQPMATLTDRALAAIENPHVDVLAHPTGRIVNQREAAPLDWPRVFEAASRTGTLLEMNGSPRLDLDDTLGRLAAGMGVMLTIASDAHRTPEFAHLDYAVSMARRAWLTADQVATTATADALLDRLR
jgi:DNA polymerase (family 10)